MAPSFQWVACLSRISQSPSQLGVASWEGSGKWDVSIQYVHHFWTVLLKEMDICSFCPLLFPAGWDTDAMAGAEAATWDSGVEAMGRRGHSFQGWAHHQAWPFTVSHPPCHRDQPWDEQVCKVAQWVSDPGLSLELWRTRHSTSELGEAARTWAWSCWASS